MGQDGAEAAAHINNISSYVLDVTAGDTLQLQVYRDIGAGNGVVNTDNATWYYVETVTSEEFATGQTTDATPTVIWSTPLAAGQGCMIEAQATASHTWCASFSRKSLRIFPCTA